MIEHADVVWNGCSDTENLSSTKQKRQYRVLVCAMKGTNICSALYNYEGMRMGRTKTLTCYTLSLLCTLRL